MTAFRARTGLSAALALLTLAALAEGGGKASTRTEIGAVVSNPELPSLAGGKARPQEAVNVNVLVFFRPDTDYSKETLAGLAACEKRTAGKPVRWVGIASDRFPIDQVRDAVKASGIAMPVLVDTADALATEIAVAQLPAVAFTDKDRKLVAYQPFMKLNFCEVVEARVRFLLGEIGEAELNAAANPAATKIGGEGSVARRHVKLAEAFLGSGNLEKALESARAAVQHGPDLSAAHSVLGECLRRSGNCKEAVPEFDKALSIDPSDARAKDGKKECAGKAS